jgi:23S rRNA (guanine745-N1)-methyltransferase
MHELDCKVSAMLLCTVRGCRRPLRREARRWVCERGHAFDVARSGYANLLQPNDRRSREPGDSAEAVAARRRLWSAAAMPPLFESGGAFEHVLDVGCGDGYWLASIDAPERHGIDISVPAIEAAAKRYPDCHWFVANADRFIPYSDASFDLVLSITARMNDAEFRRVVRDDGRLLVAVPAPDDLIELRGGRAMRDRVERTIAMFPSFELIDRKRVTTKAHLDKQGIADVLASSYRGMKIVDVEESDVTFSRDILLFKVTGNG